jgi:hypothetical protein
MNNPLQIIEEFTHKQPSPEWILNESGIPWLELDLDSPHNQMYKEIDAMRKKFIGFCKNIPNDVPSAIAKKEIAEKYNLPLFDTDKNWNFLTLYGVSSDTVSFNFDYPELKDKPVHHDFTDIIEHCPAHKKFIEENFILNDELLIKYANLGPGGFLLPHTDADNGDHTLKKLNSLTLMVKNPKGCVFNYENWGDIPIKEGRLYLLNTNYYHATQNKGDEERYHLMFRITSRTKTFIDFFKDKDLIARSFNKTIKNFGINRSKTFIDFLK